MSTNGALRVYVSPTIFVLPVPGYSAFGSTRSTMGVDRSIVDISEAIKEHLGPDLTAYTEKDLAAAVLRRQTPIKYLVSEAEEDGKGAHIGPLSRKFGKIKLEWDQSYAGRR
ncbi:hypothetical protein MMC14_009290 [Varicellaria rhodocarpa]|nr:hypothetical protein [Varicellaria rhodocarpa]